MDNFVDYLSVYLAQQYDEDLDALVLTDSDGRTQPLSGVYSRSCLPVLEEHLKAGKLKIMWMLEDMKLRKVVLPQHLSAQVFENLNTPQDVEKYKQKWEDLCKLKMVCRGFFMR